MLLNNFYYMLGKCFSNDWGTSSSKITVQDIDGNWIGSANPNAVFGFNDGYKVAVGTGINPTVSNTSYSLDGLVDNSALELVSTNKNTADWRDISVIYTTTYKNVTDSPVTVTNIGIMVKFNTSVTIMLTKEILDTPVTIQPGESYTFTSIIGA